MTQDATPHWLDKFLPDWVDFESMVPNLSGLMLREAGRLYGIIPTSEETEDEFRSRLLALIRSGGQRVNP